MYLPSNGLLYCWIHKAASTSWNKIFFDISHIGVREADLHTAAQQFRPEAEKACTLNCFKLIHLSKKRESRCAQHYVAAPAQT